jgi:hypothetical protein
MHSGCRSHPSGGLTLDVRNQTMNPGCRNSALGRSLATADVGSTVAQLVGQLSGVEIPRPTGAGRPERPIGRAGLPAWKRPLDGLSGGGHRTRTDGVAEVNF